MSPTRTRSARTGALVCLAVVAALVVVQPAQAITVKSLAIIGKNDNSGIDKRIPRSVRRALTRTFRRYNSYKLHSTARASVALREKVRLSLPGGHSLVVQPLKVRGKGKSRRILLQVEIVKGDRRIVGAAVWLKPGRYWLLGGPAVGKGVLIVALAVTE